MMSVEWTMEKTQDEELPKTKSNMKTLQEQGWISMHGEFTLMLVFNRPGRGQGLLYKQLWDKFIN